MKRYVADGVIWYAGDNVFIEMESKEIGGKPTEICLNDWLRNNVEENSKVAIVIYV